MSEDARKVKGVRFQLLGPVAGWGDGQPIALGGAQQRTVLAALLLAANQVVPTDRLVDLVWDERPAPTARRVVSQYVSRLRRALADAGVADQAELHREGRGYLIRVDPDRVDCHRFGRLVDRARAANRAGDRQQAAAGFRQALALWHGDDESLTGGTSVRLRRSLVGLCQTWLDAVEDNAELELRDDPTGWIDRLRDLAVRHPERERLAALAVDALTGAGRRNAAVELYRQLSGRIRDELDSEPTTVLKDAYRRALRDETRPTAVTQPTTVIGKPAQLPLAVPDFTGRQKQLRQLDNLVADDGHDGRPAALTVTAIAGTAGVGKTALALHWAYQHLDRFPDGQLYVNLRGFDPSGQPTAVREAVRGFLLGLGSDPSTLPDSLDALAAGYRSLVAGKRMLIVLDNANDLDQVTPLLPGSPTCTVLVTSRRHLAGLTRHGAHLLDLDVLPELDARDLLACHLGSERLAAEPAAVAELLAVCAGLPLAVAIVAALAQRHPTFPLAVLAEDLRDASARLDELDAGDLQVNLRAALSSSVRALSQQAANLFCLLGIAPGPDISLPAAAALAAISEGQARTVLRELEQASLVAEYVPSRYRMHDLIRLHATDTAHHALAEGVRQAALRQVVDFYAHTAHTADRLLDPHRQLLQLDPAGPGARRQPLLNASAALTWFDTEHDAVLAAQNTAIGCAWYATVWQLAWTLTTFHARRGHHHQRATVWQAALDAATHLGDPAARTIAHRRLGGAYAALGRFGEGIEHLQQALAVSEEQHDADQQASTHQVLATALGRSGDDRQALEHATCARDLYQALDQPVWEADALNAMGWFAARLGDYDTARAHCQAALALLRDLRHPEGNAAVLDSLGYIAHHNEQHQEAIGYYQQALVLLRALGYTSEAANTLDNLGHAHVALGEHEQARVVWREALQQYQEQGRDTDAARLQRQLDDLNNPRVRPRVGTQE